MGDILEIFPGQLKRLCKTAYKPSRNWLDFEELKILQRLDNINEITKPIPEALHYSGKQYIVAIDRFCTALPYDAPARKLIAGISFRLNQQ